MTLKQIGVWAVVVQAVVAAGGIMFFWWQLRQLKRTIRANAEGHLAEMGTQLRALVMQYPQVQPYIFGQEVPDHLDAQLDTRVRMTAEVLLHYLDNLSKLDQVLRSEDRQRWQKFAKDTLHNSPIARELITDPVRTAWYHDGLRQLVRQVEDELKVAERGEVDRVQRSGVREQGAGDRDQ